MKFVAKVFCVLVVLGSVSSQACGPATPVCAYYGGSALLAWLLGGTAVATGAAATGGLVITKKVRGRDVTYPEDLSQIPGREFARGRRNGDFYLLLETMVSNQNGLDYLNRSLHNTFDFESGVLPLKSEFVLEQEGKTMSGGVHPGSDAYASIGPLSALTCEEIRDQLCAEIIGQDGNVMHYFDSPTGEVYCACVSIQ